jgi:exonuclease SbcC
LNIQEDIAPWMNEQEHYERQLYQLSQRLTLQNQLNEQEAQERQYQQQLTATRQALENTLLALSLNVPEEGQKPPGCTPAKRNSRSGRRNKRSTACFRNA